MHGRSSVRCMDAPALRARTWSSSLRKTPLERSGPLMSMMPTLLSCPRAVLSSIAYAKARRRLRRHPVHSMFGRLRRTPVVYYTTLVKLMLLVEG